MYNKIKKNISEYSPQFIITSALILIIFGIFLFFDRPFIIANDQQFQYNIFYQEWLRLINNFLKTGELPFYSWYKFLGSDFYSSASIYVTGDFLIPLLMLFKKIEHALLFESIILVYISGFSFNVFLLSFGIKERKTRTFVSIIYAFTGLAVFYFGNYMFHRFYSILPFMFAGIESYLYRNRPYLFTISVAFLFITSIYFMFPSSLFLVIYFVFTYNLKSKEFKLAEFIAKSSFLIMHYILGFAISAVVTLPAILFLIENPRLGVSYDFSIIWDFEILIGYFMSHIAAPFPIYTNIPYMFVSGTNGHATWYSVYASSITVVMLFSYFLFIKDQQKRHYLFLYLTTLFIIMIKPINSIFHGFSEPSFRFVFLYIIVILLILAHTLDKRVYIPSIRPFLVVLTIFIILSVILYMINLLDYSLFYQHINFVLISLSSMFIFVVLWHFKFTRLAFAFTFFEIAVFSTFVIYNLNLPAYNYEPSLTKEYVQYYQDIDDDLFYRVYLNPKHLYPTSELNLNQSLNYNYNSTTTYDTGYESQLVDFLRINGFDWHIIHIDDPELLELLGVKYYIVFDESELPNGYEFEYVYDLDFLKVYKLINHRSIGFTYNHFEILESLKDYSNISWNDTLLIYKKDQERINNILPSEYSSELIVSSISTNSIQGEITSDEKTILFLSIPYNEGWKVIVDGKNTEYFKVHGGFLGIELNEGYHFIELYFVPKGFKLGFYITISGFILVLLQFIFNRLNVFKSNTVSKSQGFKQ